MTTVDTIISAACNVANVTRAELLGPSRSHDVLHARQAAMYFIRANTKLSYRRIGQLCGGLDHSTAIHACKVCRLGKRDWYVEEIGKQLRGIETPSEKIARLEKRIAFLEGEPKWTKHHGGPNPAPGKLVRYKLANGRHYVDQSDALGWSHSFGDARPANVTHYQVLD